MDLHELPLDRFINVLADFFVEDAMSEFQDERDKARGRVLRMLQNGEEPGYDSTESYGRSNDDASLPSAPRPYSPIKYNEQTEDGYFGLDAPMGTIR